MIENATNLTNTTALVDTFGIFKGVLLQHLKWIIGVLAPGVIAMVIYRFGILPDIEPRYELKQIDPESGLLKSPIQQDFFNKNKDKYGDMYSHFILFNGGHGKASNIKVEYNWSVNGEIGGVSNEAIRRAGLELRYHDYLFPGKEHFSVPALEFRSNVFEEAEWILLRVRYKDIIGFNHCRCVVFDSIHGERGLNMVPESHNYCGGVSRCFKKMTKTCNFREDVCSTEGLIPILEADTLEGKND
uniref:Uncharacterized protein n=1 Tax=Candidatus Methanophaga sp. ANME-1 ERB7 TaxID=2759913 RepID=A0A7G9Z5Q1_9EURY|nr:hypothetical protein BJEEAEJC_00028 [Methanosarcinales archaeon ANME-1 ERB7]